MRRGSVQQKLTVVVGGGGVVNEKKTVDVICQLIPLGITKMIDYSNPPTKYEFTGFALNLATSLLDKIRNAISK